MKLPNQAQPIIRGISTAKIIGAKGIVQNGRLIDCRTCLKNCGKDIKAKGVKAMGPAICAAKCLDNCKEEFKDQYDVMQLFKDLTGLGI